MHISLILFMSYCGAYFRLSSALVPPSVRDSRLLPNKTRYPRITPDSSSHNNALFQRSGWQDIEIRSTFNVSSHSLSPKPPTLQSRVASNSLSGTLKAVGKAISVAITWYTGHDLENPSCWTNGGWTPTDDSHVCALTQVGWSDRPRCFDFLELCNSDKCVFVRVVDTCAGCAPGSKHVDLTKAAFSSLASLQVGNLNVKMRRASSPTKWDTNLYGPHP